MLRGSLEDMKEYEKEMKEQMQSKIREDMQRRKDQVEEMKAMKALEGKLIKYVDGFFHEDSTEGIVVGKYGTFYFEDHLIPDPLFESAEYAHISGYSNGSKSQPYKSLFLNIDFESEEIVERSYKIDDSKMMSFVCIRLSENDIEYTSTENTIIIHSDPRRASEILSDAVNEYRINSPDEDKEDYNIHMDDLDCDFDDEYIDGNTLI